MALLPSFRTSIRFSERSRNWRYWRSRRFSTCLIWFPARDRKLQGKREERLLEEGGLPCVGSWPTSGGTDWGEESRASRLSWQRARLGEPPDSSRGVAGFSPPNALLLCCLGATYRREVMHAKFSIRWILFCGMKPRWGKQV